jgi:hypothetical protein
MSMYNAHLGSSAYCIDLFFNWLYLDGLKMGWDGIRAGFFVVGVVYGALSEVQSNNVTCSYDLV